MQIFIGLWKPTARWTDMSAPARTAYLSKVSAITRLKLGSSAESIAWGHNDEASSAERFHFFCVWRFPTHEMSDTYLSILADNGWNDYFDTISVKGAPKTPFDVMTQHVLL